MEPKNNHRLDNNKNHMSQGTYQLLLLGMVIPPPYRESLESWYMNPYNKIDDDPYHRKPMGD